MSAGKDGVLLCAAVKEWSNELGIYRGNAGLRQVTGQAEGLGGRRVAFQPPPQPRGPWGLAASPVKETMGFLLIAGEEQRFLVSRDGGTEWQVRPLPPELVAGKALAADPGRAERVYVGSRMPEPGLFFSEDAGATWQKALASGEGIVDIAATAQGTLYALGEGGTLWRSAARGLTWLEPVRTGVAPASNLSIDPRDEKRLFVAGDDRIAVSPDGGATWQALEDRRRSSLR